MPLFRPKQRVSGIEARQVTKDFAEDIATWCGGLLVTEIDTEDPSKTFVGINVPTYLGVERASQGSWVVKLQNGRFTTYNDVDFNDTYEAVDA